MLSDLEKNKRLTFREVNLHLRSNGIYSSVKNMFRVFETVKEFKPDLMLLEGPGCLSIITLIVKKIYKLPLIVRVKGDLWQTYNEIELSLPLYEKFAKYLNFKAANLILRNSDMILPISDRIGMITRDNLKMSKPMFTVHIPYIETPLKDGHDAENAAEAPPPYANGDFVLTVTNFNFWAKVEPLLDAIRKASPVLGELGIKWIILGDGFFLDKFKQSVDGWIGTETTQFLGRQNPYPFYNNAKALFYVSGMDGLPNVLLEAWNSKLPIVINKECDSVEFVVDGYNGIIADFNDRAQITAIINKISSDREFRNTIGDNAHLYMKECFSINVVSSQLERAIQNSLENSRN